MPEATVYPAFFPSLGSIISSVRNEYSRQFHNRLFGLSLSEKPQNIINKIIMFSCLHVGRVIRILNPNPHLWTFSMPRFFSHCLLFLQASTPYSLESESLRMDCIMSGGASPTLAINAVTNKVGHQLFISCFNTKQRNSAGIQSLCDRTRGFHPQLDTDRGWFGIWRLSFYKELFFHFGKFNKFK